MRDDATMSVKVDLTEKCHSPVTANITSPHEVEIYLPEAETSTLVPAYNEHFDA